MDFFKSAVDLIFTDNSMARSALFHKQGEGDGILVRIILRAPDALQQFNGGRFRQDAVFIDVRVSEVPELSKHDTFELLADDGTPSGEIYEFTGEPARDRERLIWQGEAASV
ncbi:hypothetical protein [Pseudovibrio sp. Tun.PSC04-5.I4]|uniref:head-tail joining protein n=1 Tax=Pseudovibrio sp. Tun.PSC04-5.I4 TaxID=1798213 RepID=UPI0008891ED8|nr:hypothetical protein [Pseudovibrio sp. Tun.PSC04-5.I4]SDR39917.1 hypothetical protein SAMN04515695_5365 [Pseudovibrio sp. Tun.PSC04-5.I4]